MRLFFYFLLLLVILAGTSCETKFYDEIDNRANSEYFPFKEGKYRVYRVDSLKFYPDGPVTIIDTTHGILREETRNLKYISKNHVTFEIWRTYEALGKESDAVTRVWSAEIEDGKWFQNEENLRFFLVNFDADVSDRWESLLFNPSNVTEIIGQSPILPYIEWRSRLVSKEEILQSDSFEFSNALLLERAALINSLLELRMCNEWFVKGVGMVKSERWILDSQCIACPEEDWAGKAEIGYIVKQELIDYN